MGTAAVRVLLTMLEGGDPEHVRMPADLVVRGSTAAPRHRRRAIHDRPSDGTGAFIATRATLFG
ncbi:MAG: hypothetical protein QM630_04915 [Microbacterium sp.]